MNALKTNFVDGGGGHTVEELYRAAMLLGSEIMTTIKTNFLLDLEK